MKIIKKSKVDIDKGVFENIVRVYIDYVKKSLPDLNFKELSELFRHSLCISLGLDSKGFNTYIDTNAIEFSKVLTPLLKEQNVLSKSNDYKSGFLEACIHYMEFSIERAEYGK